MAVLDGVAHRPVGADSVAVATALPQAVQIAGVHQIADDALGGAFGDSHPFGDVAKPDPRIPRDADQGMGVVCQERPFRHTPKLT